MTRYTFGIAVAVFLLVDASSGWSQQYYLYSPAPLESAVNVQGKDGVLVQEVLVQKGDTLSGISHRFSGRGAYYSQILLFNDIKDPNKIYPGNVFRVPVSRQSVTGQAEKVTGHGRHNEEPRKTNASTVQKQLPVEASVAPFSEISTQDLKKVDAGREKKRATKEKGTDAAKKPAAVVKQPAIASGDSAAGQKLFERAVNSYRQDDYRLALELFDKYLTENPASPLAADASLYKAECYLKLSAQK